MPSDKSTRKQRHQAAIKPQKGKAVRGAQATEFVKGAGYRKSEFIGGKKFFTPMSPDPTSSGAGGDVTNITVSGGGNTIQGAILADGTVPFNSTQVGISPTETAHIATKGYVDSNTGAFELTGNVTGGTSGATAVATTIANDAVTYAKMQNIAGRRFLGRNTNSSGDAEEITTAQAVTLLALESGNADEYLCGNGVFREVSASTSMTGLNDTSIQSIADDHMLVYTYISENHAGNLWKNESVASAIRPKLSATAPLAYNNSTGDFTHQTGAGKNHIPSGGSSGQFLKYSSSGVATWAIPSYTTSLAWSAITSQPNIQYTSAITQSELRSTLGTGNLGLVPDTGNSGEFLSHNGTFDEISVAVSIAGLSDTAIESLGTRHFLYYDGSNYWKNSLLQTGDIPNLDASKITAGTLPVSRGGTGLTSGYNKTSWDTQAGYGNHATQGYIVNLILKEGDGGSNTVTSTNKYIEFRTAQGSYGGSAVSGSGASNSPWIVTLNAPDTNTTYSVGDGGLTQNNFTNADHTKLNGIETGANNYNFQLQDDDGDTVTINDGHYVKINNGTGITTNWNATDAAGTSGDPHILTITSTTAGTVNAVGVSGAITGGVTLNASSGTIGHSTAAGYTHVPTTASQSGKFLKATSNSGGSEAWTAISASDMSLGTSNSVRFGSLGIGTNASGTTGEIRATNEVTAYYSDDRLKNRYGNIDKALEKVCSLNGFHYQPNEAAGQLGYDTSQKKVGVSAQEVLKVLPEAVTEAPIDPQYHAVQYDKLVPLLIEAIKELSSKGCCCGTK